MLEGCVLKGMVLEENVGGKLKCWRFTSATLSISDLWQQIILFKLQNTSFAMANSLTSAILRREIGNLGTKLNFPTSSDS